MMHADNELYKINGQKFYTWDYIEMNNIPKAKRYEKEGWSVAWSVADKKGYINIHTANGVVKGYTYGEHTWFDTEEERDEHRAFQNALREEETKRNKMLKIIMEHYKNLSTEELEKALATL